MNTISQLMTRDVVELTPETTVREAAALLTEHQVSGAPVVDADGRVLGIVSESDLLSEARRRAALPRSAAFGLFLVSEETLLRLYHAGADLPVREVMSSRLISVTESTPATEAARLLVNEGVNRLPVLDADGKLVGIVTRADLLKAVFSL